MVSLKDLETKLEAEKEMLDTLLRLESVLRKHEDMLKRSPELRRMVVEALTEWLDVPREPTERPRESGRDRINRLRGVVAGFFRGRDNRPATIREISDATGLTRKDAANLLYIRKNTFVTVTRGEFGTLRGKGAVPSTFCMTNEAWMEASTEGGGS